MKNNSNLGGLFYVQGKGGRMPVEEKTEQWETGEKVVEIELERLRTFTNHPFKVQADDRAPGQHQEIWNTESVDCPAKTGRSI